jgi:threonine dehydratase
MGPESLRTAIPRVEAAIRPWIVETPLVASSLGPFFKLEHQQHTGSFKARGAFAKLLDLTPGERAAGVLAASTGNHGAAVAYAARALGVPARIVVPRGANPRKLAAIAGLGGSLEEHGADSAEAEVFARREAARLGRPYVSPYNDPVVIAGQGSIGVEIDRALPGVDEIFIALGGGGLLAGVAAWLKGRNPAVRVVGCSPENSAVMIASLRAGRILALASKPTLSDGTAGGLEADAVTFPLCRDLADECVTVTEAEILDAMRRVYDSHGWLVEGAAGVAFAGYRRAGRRGRRSVVILCGGNVDPAVLRLGEGFDGKPAPG